VSENSVLGERAFDGRKDLDTRGLFSRFFSGNRQKILKNIPDFDPEFAAKVSKSCLGEGKNGLREGSKNGALLCPSHFYSKG
jgi:hypothetical protein